MEKTNRNVILDVMRGLAGLAVPMMHLREGFGWTGEFCGHTYFAVEFYILLMAYMFGAAYDRRWYRRWRRSCSSSPLTSTRSSA